nr:hypothetical protein [Tanacetum cinerariifolium]
FRNLAFVCIVVDMSREMRVCRKDTIDEEIVSFIKELGYKGNIKSITDVVVDQMHQPWRTFASIINKCLSRKITDFVFQVDNSDIKKQEKMYYPRFTKAIIYHFINKDKTISMRNKLFMHTAQHDSVLGTLRFVSKSKDFQVYGALLPEVMTNQKMRDSSGYKTYLAFTIRAATPKKARKIKKHASSSKKKAKRETNIHQAGGSTNSSKSEYESWGDSGDEDVDDQQSDDERTKSDDEQTKSDNPKTSDDEEETQDDEYVHTSEDYVPTDDETNDESNDVNETYLAFTIRAATPKKARKIKKHASSSKKKALVVVKEPADKPIKKPVAKRQSAGVRIRDTPGVSVSNKKAPAKVERIKGIDLLLKAALHEEAHLKKALK